MADISSIKLPNNTTYNIKDSSARQSDHLNLLLSTSTNQSKESMTMSTNNEYTTWDPYDMIKPYADLKLTTNNYVSVSFNYVITNAPAGALVKVGTNANPWEFFGTVLTTTAGSSSGSINKTFKVTDTLASCAASKLRFRFDNATGMSITISKAKLEISSYCTPWVINPADVLDSYEPVVEWADLTNQEKADLVAAVAAMVEEDIGSVDTMSF